MNTKILGFSGRKLCGGCTSAGGDLPESAVLHALPHVGGLLRGDPGKGGQFRHMLRHGDALCFQSVLRQKHHRIPGTARHVCRLGDQRVLPDFHVRLVTCLAFGIIMISMKRSPTSARVVMTYWRDDSTSAVYQQPPFLSKIRRMLSHSTPVSESMKYISSPSVVMHTLQSMSLNDFSRGA